MHAHAKLRGGRKEEFSSRTDRDSALDDHLAVGLIGDTIDLGKIVRVGDDLVAGDSVLLRGVCFSINHVATKSKIDKVSCSVRGVGLRSRH